MQALASFVCSSLSRTKGWLDIRSARRRRGRCVMHLPRYSLALDPRQNRLLAALADLDNAPWLPDLEPVDLPLGLVLYEPGGILSHVYFPTTAIVSLLYVLENGSSAEIAVVGNEGLVGISLFMGGESTPSRAVVQSAGEGLRLKSRC